ncbi:homologous-pairing protein 2 homolog [Venturia canescens]|uniref:homologous-pairing protein 2 homolog n=1 Tax=Venturia canescens TaxID=32260 RepID=UPI001C9CBBF5|nr:homologous-pairing protein 2 homolog [Venturia canescens]
MATEAVYEYMQCQNRPFSANDIVTNLNNQHPKPVVQKALDKLVAKNKVFEKAYGKQKIYCLVQDPSQDTDELLRINRELQCHANEVEMKRTEVDKSIREYESKLALLRQHPCLEEALKIRDELKKRVKELTDKLDALMETTGSQDLGTDKKKAEDKMKEYSREYGKRKRLCTDIIDCILEGYPGSKKALQEEIGIEIKIVQ